MRWLRLYVVADRTDAAVNDVSQRLNVSSHSFAPSWDFSGACMGLLAMNGSCTTKIFALFFMMTRIGVNLLRNYSILFEHDVYQIARNERTKMKPMIGLLPEGFRLKGNNN